MNYKGREIDPVAFWSGYVEFPANMRLESNEIFLPKVVCPNPEHSTSKRHFQVNAQEPKVHCFAHCGISGTWEHALCVVLGLYEKFNVDLVICERAWNTSPVRRSQEEREQLRRQMRAREQASRIIRKGASGTASKISKKSSARNSRSASPVPVEQLAYESYLPPIALDYLAARGLIDRSVATWEIGWLPEEKRIAIPACDENGVLKFLIKRSVLPTQNPKYLYTEGFAKTSLLFGAGQLELGMVKSSGLIIVEGSIDTILNHQHGLTNTVAILGTGISEQQRRIIARINPKKIFLMFDKDTAGVRNIEIAARVLRKYPLFVVRYPRGRSDPAEMTKEEKYRQISRAVPLSNFIHGRNLNVKGRKQERKTPVA